MSQTISQILDEYDGFEKAFWASYSANFTTLDFLLKKDFKHIMNPHYLHFICDGHQLNESISRIDEERKDMAKLCRLQEYCTISPQFTAGSFHPKILLFTSKAKLLFIVSSANATPSGILSNQDLIGSFYYDDDHPESKNEVCSLFQYMRSYDGWGAEAREDFKVVAEDFDFLNENLPTNTVLTIPNKENLLSQITKGLPEAKIQKINIFSPFFDDNYEAIFQIDDHFNVPVNIFSPQKEFQTTRKDDLSSNIKFYHSGTEINKSFHAKFYEFNYGDESIVYWGSANCSYSGLLSIDRNYEFLVKCQMSKEDIHSLWGPLINKEESSVEYGHQIDQKDNHKNLPAIYVKGILITEDGFTIRLDKPLFEKAVLKGIISNGSVVNLTIKDVEGDEIHAVCEEDGLIILYVEKDQKRISNLIYVNNPFALQARVSGKQNSPDFDPQDIKDSKAVTHAFGYFNLKRPKQKSSGSHSAISRKGFWRLPQFKSRSHLSGIINLESFIKQRVIKLKEKNDPETFTDDGNKGRLKEASQRKSILDVVTRETDKLLKNIILIVKEKKISEIEVSRWFQGIDIINCYILDYLDGITKLPKENKGLAQLLLATSRVSAWMIYNLIDNSEDHKERIELIRTVQDILLGLSIYNLLFSQEFSPALHSSKNIDQLTMVKRALHLRYLTSEKFSEFKSGSEHSQLTCEDILAKLPHMRVGAKTIDIFERRKIAELTGLDEVQIFTNGIVSLLFIKKSGKNMELETILGEEKKFSHTNTFKNTNILQ